MSRAVLLRPAARLSAFYAAIFLVSGIQWPSWPVWLATQGLDARQIGFLLAAAIWAGLRGKMTGALGASALLEHAAMMPVKGFWLLVLLYLVAWTAQSGAYLFMAALSPSRPLFDWLGGSGRVAKMVSRTR